MANPTSNYGWVLPTSTDLVTDLPADFDVALQGVDTRLKALNPATTLGDLNYASSTANTNTRLGIGSAGQVLTVVGGVPAWQTGTTGDIEGVTAGVGISGGGTSGTVTVTNSMATAITTNGDLIYGTGSGTFARLGIGSAGQALTVSGGVPAWSTVASGSMTQIATGSLSGATTTISSISSSYKDLKLVLNNVSITGSDEITMQLNGYTSGYNWMSFRAGTSSPDYSTSGNQIKIPTGNTLNTDTSYRAVIDFPNYSTSGPVFCNFNGVFNCNAATTGLQVFMGTGSNTTSAVLSSITLKANWGGAFTFDSGTYTLFGVN